MNTFVLHSHTIKTQIKLLLRSFVYLRVVLDYWWQSSSVFSNIVWPHQRSVFDSADQLEPFCRAFAHSHRVCMRVSGALWFLPQVQTHAGYIALKCDCRFECVGLIKCLRCNIRATCLEYTPCLAQCLHVIHLNVHILVTF